MCAKLTGTLKEWFTPHTARFSQAEVLLAALRAMDTAAIEYLMDKTEGTVRSMVRKAGQPAALTQDLLHDGLVILIEKICDNTFDPAKSSPQTYLTGICRKLLANLLRGKRPPTAEPIENGLDIPSDELRNYFDQKDRLELLEHLLERLGPPGNELIRLKYLEGYSDAEQIEQKMTPYATLDSLKTSRSHYLKKLALLAREWKEHFVIGRH